MFITTLNEMIDDQEKWLTALQSRVPTIIFVALYGIAFVAHGFAGYADGLENRKVRLPVYTMAILVITVILLIHELDRPTGLIQTSPQPIVNVAASLANHTGQK